MPAAAATWRRKACPAWAGSEPAGPLIGGALRPGQATDVTSPADRRVTLGRVVAASAADVAQAVKEAAGGFADWDSAGVERRAAILETASDLLEEDRAGFLALLVRGGGQSVSHPPGELPGTVGFLRYH